VDGSAGAASAGFGLGEATFDGSGEATGDGDGNGESASEATGDGEPTTGTALTSGLLVADDPLHAPTKIAIEAATTTRRQPTVGIVNPLHPPPDPSNSSRGSFRLVDGPAAYGVS
jgi:hypothetical protein